MPRFVLLEHTGHPDDPAGRHYDLLLEEPDACQTWRLAEIPVAGGGPVAAVPLPPHRLAWLDIEAGPVSGGRGFARRVDAGTYRLRTGNSAADERESHAEVVIDLAGSMLQSTLALSHHDGWLARLA
jgi:hypothetical protein